MPGEYPLDTTADGYEELTKKFKSRFGIEDQYEFEGSS